jgi:hypothetical protein
MGPACLCNRLRQQKRMRLRILITILGLLAMLTIWVMLCNAPIDRRLPTIGFQSYGNNAAGQRVAIFCITNIDACTLRFARGSCYGGKGLYPAVETWSITNSTHELSPGASCTVAVVVPTGMKRWMTTWQVTRLMPMTGLATNYQNSAWCPKFLRPHVDWVQTQYLP